MKLTKKKHSSTFGKGRTKSTTFGKGRTKSTTFGKGRTKSTTFGKGRTKSTTFGKGRTFKKVYKNNKIEYFFPSFTKTKRNKGKLNNNNNQIVKKMSAGGIRYNEQFIDLMEKLSSIMLKQGEPFRARAYQKAQETLMAYPQDISYVDQLKGAPGIGSTILEKLNEYVNTGTLKILEREKNNPVNILGEIYGVGPKKAKELVEKGITTIEQLRAQQDQVLNDVQKVGLKYYEDILKRIPRTEVQEYETIFDADFKKVTNSDPASRMEIVGSFRRGAETSGDIDVIITSDTPDVFKKFIDELIKEKIILEVLSRGSTKCLVIAKIPSSNTARRIDFLYTTPKEYPFSILYFTGSKIFNTVMRHEALKLGLSMNEHGLYKMEGKKKGEKVDVLFKNEKDIFDYLNLEYKTPIERIDGRAVVTLNKSNDNALNTEQDIQSFKVTKVTKLTKTIKKKKPIVIESDTPVTSINTSTDSQIDENGKNILDLLISFKTNGISVLNNLDEKTLSDMVTLSNEKYRNKQPIISDNQFDILEDFIKEKFPDNKVIKQIGAPIPSSKNKAVLPYEMWSMDKIKPDTKALETWKNKYDGPYVISCKLDGVSGLYTTNGPDGPKLYTRGDGKIGQDVSHFIPYLRLPGKNVSSGTSGSLGMVIRGEFVISKTIFNDKYKKEFANPRNLVSGIVNQKTVDIEKIKDVHFVAYEVIVPTMKPSEQFDFLKTLDIDIVLNENVENGDLTNELLSQKLIEWRKNYLYEIDGVIVINDKIYPRKTGNPEHAFAFKMVLSDQVAETTVVDVIWNPSKDGYLKPRVQIKPVNLGGVRIEYATGFNGAFIKDNMIGIGAVVEIIRSGDVIPYIRKVIVGAEQPKMPSVPYQWNDTHVDVLLEDKMSDETVKEKNITGFFRGIGVEGLSSGNISRIIKAGYDSVAKIINMSIDDLKSVEGFQLKTATKIHDGIKARLNKVSLVTLMAATNIFGRGFNEKKIELIMEDYHRVFDNNISDAEKIKKISEIKGMAQKTAEAFVSRIDDFEDFLMETDMFQKLFEYQKQQQDKKEQKSMTNDAVGVEKEKHLLYGKTIVITGFRNKALEEKLKNIGAKFGSSVSKNTFLLIAKDKDDETGKVLEAKNLNIPILSLGDFLTDYNLEL
jgi:NAD-dependent DNA ligase